MTVELEEFAKISDKVTTALAKMSSLVSRIEALERDVAALKTKPAVTAPVVPKVDPPKVTNVNMGVKPPAGTK